MAMMVIDTADVMDLEQFCDGFVTAEGAYRATGPLGRARLLENPDFKIDLSYVRPHLDYGVGFVSFEDTGIDRLSPLAAQYATLVLGSLIEEPFDMDGTGKLISIIRYQPGLTGDDIPDSKHAQLSPYHNDGTHLAIRPRYTTLAFCVVDTSAPLAGASRFALVDHIIVKMIENAGAAIIPELSKPYPFMVNPAHTAKGAPLEPHVAWYPIIDPKTRFIRFRRSNIDNALAVPGIVISPQQHQALDFLEKAIIGGPQHWPNFAAGDVVFMHGGRTVHGRFPFDESSGRTGIRCYMGSIP